MYMEIYTSTMCYFHILIVAVETEETREGTVIEHGELVIQFVYSVNLQVSLLSKERILTFCLLD